MRDMRIGEEISAVADPRGRAGGGAAIDGAKFAKRVAVADLEMRRLAGVFQILRALPDGCVGVKTIRAPDFRRAAKGDVMLQPAILAEDDFFFDDAIGPDERA